MNDSEFEAPPLMWAALPIVGGIATGLGLILGLGWLGHRLTPEPDPHPTSASVGASSSAQTASVPEPLHRV
jgi:hypothetical protein